jgi:hypothetical protein
MQALTERRISHTARTLTVLFSAMSVYQVHDSFLGLLGSSTFCACDINERQTAPVHAMEVVAWPYGSTYF